MEQWLALVRGSVLRSTAASAEERQLCGSADGATIPLVYGEDRVGGLILNAAPYQGFVYFEVLWAHAGDSVNVVQLNNKDLPAGSSITNYNGSQGSADSTFTAAMAANGYTYAEYHAGYMYSIIAVPVAGITGALQFTARIRGRKLYDPRKDSTNGGSGAHRLDTPSTWEWSDCPALADADFLYSSTYGCGKSVLWSSVIAVANLNDALVGGAEKRRQIGLAITEPRLLKDYAETLRAYAGCFHSPTESGIKLIGDTPRLTDAAYSHAAGEIAALVSCEKKDQGDTPTVVEIRYTNTGVFPWRDAFASVEAAGVAGGTIPRRVSQIPMPGVQRYSQAIREATERLNKLITSDLTVVVDVFDKAMAHEEGDVIEVTHPIGLTSKKLRIGPPQMVGPGLWRLSGQEYDPAAYSDSVASGPTYGDTDAVALPAASPINIVQNSDWTDDIGYGSGGYVDARALRAWSGVVFGGATAYFGRNKGDGGDWNLGRGGCYLQFSGTLSGSQGAYIYNTPKFRITAGFYYEGQVLAAILRCKGWMLLRYWNAALTAYKDAMGGADEVDSGSGGVVGSRNKLDDRALLWRFAKAPVTADGSSGWSNATAQDAAFAELVIGVTGNGGTDPYLILHRSAIFAHAADGLTKQQVTPWVEFNAPTIGGQRIQEGTGSLTGTYTSTNQSGGWYEISGGGYGLTLDRITGPGVLDITATFDVECTAASGGASDTLMVRLAKADFYGGDNYYLQQNGPDVLVLRGDDLNRRRSVSLTMTGTVNNIANVWKTYMNLYLFFYANSAAMTFSVRQIVFTVRYARL